MYLLQRKSQIDVRRAIPTRLAEVLCKISDQPLEPFKPKRIHRHKYVLNYSSAHLHGCWSVQRGVGGAWFVSSTFDEVDGMRCLWRCALGPLMRDAMSKISETRLPSRVTFGSKTDCKTWSVVGVRSAICKVDTGNVGTEGIREKAFIYLFFDKKRNLI